MFQTHIRQDLLDCRLAFLGCLQKEHTQIKYVFLLVSAVPNYSDRGRQGGLGQADLQSEPARFASNHYVIRADFERFQFEPRPFCRDLGHSDVDIFFMAREKTGKRTGPRDLESLFASSVPTPTTHFKIPCQGARLKTAELDDGFLAIAASRSL